MKIKFATFVFILVILPGCNEESTSPNNSIFGEYTSILQTDIYGNVIGGDTTDWCYEPCLEPNGIPACNKLYPVYPNPVIDTLNIRFDIRNKSSYIRLYFLNSDSDTLFLKNDTSSAGYYLYRTSRNNLGYSNVYKRLFIQIDDFTCFGDIKFN